MVWFGTPAITGPVAPDVYLFIVNEVYELMVPSLAAKVTVTDPVVLGIPVIWTDRTPLVPVKVAPKFVPVHELEIAEKVALILMLDPS